jgi:phosphopantothenoylcysteine decarboxylase/phosphopantothenate--cysteine ligase
MTSRGAEQEDTATDQLAGRELLVGVCGGIAAYKTAALVSQLAQAGAGVTVVLTSAAEKFVGAATFAALSSRPALRDLFDADRFPLGAHIELARRADLFCVAPATANFLAQAAHGLADDLLSTLALSFSGPTLFAPAMNTEMWEKAAVKRNVSQLRSDGVQFIGPDSGWLSCRTEGAGRMAAPEAIFTAIVELLASPSDRIV